MQISTISISSSKFPDSLREIPSAPKTINVLGNLTNAPAISIVGSRVPTAYGKEMTHQLAYELARAGFTIVSGLALGCDGIAHRGALEAKGHTVAVLASPVDDVTPYSHRSLAKQILESGGAIVSEYPSGTPLAPWQFAARNRIVTGLSLGVIVTEAKASSGSLISANFALAQDRLVFAVPGPITSAMSAGPNNLIKAGAIPITGSADVLAALNFSTHLVEAKPVAAKSHQEATILRLMGEGITTSQELIERSKLPAAEFANIISLMEITGKVRNLGAGHWSSN